MKRFPLSRRHFLQGSAALAGAGVVAGPKLGWSAGEKILRVRMPSQFKSLDPGYMFGSTEMAVQFACLGTLATYAPTEKLSWQPSYFVTSIEPTDELNIRFTLRPGVAWTNGFGEVTTEDVKFSFERMKDSEWGVKFDSVDHVEIIDTYTGVVRLKYPFAPIWYTTICNGTGCIVSKKAVEAAGGKFDTELPAECGPYVFKNFKPEQSWELHRNPLWTGPKPDIDEVHFIVVREDKTAELAFEAGELDMTRISTDSAPRYRENLPENSTLVELPGNWWSWLGMNTEHPKLQDIRVRRAIQHAVNVEAILEAAWSGASPRARGIVPRGQIGYRTHTAIEKPDLDRARALLAEAGVSNLSLTLKTVNQADFNTAAQVVQANLAEIGIDVEVVPMEPGTFWIQGIEAEGEQWKDLELYIIQYADSPDPSQATQWYVSDQVGIWNWERWKNPEFDELHQKGMVESDEQKRHESYIRMQDLMEETGAYVWLTHQPSIWLHRTHFVPSIWVGFVLNIPGFEWASA